MHRPERRPLRLGADLNVDRCITHVAAVEPERRDEEIDSSLDPSAVIKEHDAGERRVVIKGR